jgi:hypothetical protein
MPSSVLRLLCVVVALSGAMSLRAAVSVDRSVASARVTRLAATPAADLVLIDAGHEAGFRQGMVCVATRGGEKIGELLLVDLRPRAASALILDLNTGRGLQPGDRVAVKTVSSKK